MTKTTITLIALATGLLGWRGAEAQALHEHPHFDCGYRSPSWWLEELRKGVERGEIEWMWDGEFTLQVLLWNPGVFPELPEQYSAGLYVRVKPDGSVVTRPYGTGTGIEVWAETEVNAEGQPVVRFPFTIPGM